MYWTNQRAAQACAQQAQGPTVFGLGQRAWHEAGQSFQEAADAERVGENDKAEHFRSLGLRRLADAGLTLDMTLPRGMRPQGNRPPESDTEATQEFQPFGERRQQQAPPRPSRQPEMYTAMMQVCAERALRLKNASARMTGANALACAAYLGAAGVMERAATEWMNRNSVAANSFMEAAERLLLGAMVSVPWRRHEQPQGSGR